MRTPWTRKSRRTPWPGCSRASCDGALLRSPAERASFHFVRQTLAGSRGHRILVASYAGAGAALVFQALTGVIARGSPGWWHTPAGPLLPAPLVLSLFLLTGLRYAFTVPAELPANWIFRLSDPALAGQHLRGVKKAVALTALAPLFGGLWAVYAPLWGVRLATLHILFAAVVAWLLLESLLVGFEKLPFTCSYVAGKANLKLSWPIYVLGYAAYVSALSALEYWMLAAPQRFLWLLPVVVLSSLALAWHARQRRLLGEPLLFDDQPDPAVQTLGLAQ